MKKSPSRRLFLQKSAMATTGLALLTSGLANALSNESPYHGYNPYSEEKTDLRTTIFEKHVRVKGTVYNKTEITPQPDAIVEVWHLSPNSKKYRHQAKLKTNNNGEYSFITDYPNNEVNKLARIYFKVTHNGTSFFTELILNSTGAHINDKHWEESQELGHKLFPTTEKFLNTSTINFNLSI